MALILALATWLTATPAGAMPVTQTRIEPTSDFANYPVQPLPALCQDPTTALDNVKFSTSTQTADRLEDLELRAGDTVGMSWTGYKKECQYQNGPPLPTVTLSMHITENWDYTPTETQWVKEWTNCVSGTCHTDNGSFYHIEIKLVANVVVKDAMQCATRIQLDAHFGPSLLKVGPDGSYYNSNSGTRSSGLPGDMLISAGRGFAQATCEEEITTTTQPETPSTTQPESPSTTQGTTPAPTTSAPDNGTENSTTIPQEQLTPSTMLITSQTLPFTGPLDGVKAEFHLFGRTLTMSNDLYRLFVIGFRVFGLGALGCILALASKRRQSIPNS